MPPSKPAAHLARKRHLRKRGLGSPIARASRTLGRDADRRGRRSRLSWTALDPSLPAGRLGDPQSFTMNGSMTYSCVPASLWKTILYGCVNWALVFFARRWNFFLLQRPLPLAPSPPG